MININTFKYLSNQKKRDAATLLSNQRNSRAIYLMGYALEFALKRKVSQTLGFHQGFPEKSIEFSIYFTQINGFNSLSTGIELTNLHQIKNHNLSQLLIYSGAEIRIKASYNTEWLVVKDWDPEDRYKVKKYSKRKAKTFVRSANKILAQIM